MFINFVIVTYRAALCNKNAKRQTHAASLSLSHSLTVITACVMLDRLICMYAEVAEVEVGHFKIRVN